MSSDIDQHFPPTPAWVRCRPDTGTSCPPMVVTKSELRRNIVFFGINMKHHVVLMIWAQDWIKILIGLNFFFVWKTCVKMIISRAKWPTLEMAIIIMWVKNVILIPMAPGYSLDWWLWWNIKHNGLFNWSEMPKMTEIECFCVNCWKWRQIKKCNNALFWRLSAFGSWRHNNASFKQIFFSNHTLLDVLANQPLFYDLILCSHHQSHEYTTRHKIWPNHHQNILFTVCKP